MASDSLISSDGLKWSDCSKIKKVKGWLIGAAGPWDASETFMDHFDPEIHVKARKIAIPASEKGADGFCALMISPTGKVYYTEAGGVLGTLRTYGFIAIGCGEQVGMAAMEMGATAEQAVKVAIKYNPNCGGRVQKIKL